MDVRDCGLCLDADPVQISQHIWSWLQMPLLGSGTVELDYNNGQTLNGIEAWRRLVVKPRTESRPMARRFTLRDNVNHPGQCKSFADMLERPVSWKVDLADYVTAGAPQPPDEDLRHALIKMLPGSLSSEMRGKAWAQATAFDLKEWVRTQDEFEKDYCKANGVHLAQTSTPAGLPHLACYGTGRRSCRLR